ncbi:B3 domain-containing transcription factor [Salix suchowensis]|nr:B3 domain-containing transcription factor [Salix suchowensis]
MGEGDAKPSVFVAKPPHFFKVILEDSLREGKLMLPQKFVTRHGMDLTNLAHLKVHGEAWEIELTKCDGKVWLQKGWKEFAEHYSVACDHFLVFEYEGNCDFRVLIFDNSATEMDYPLKNNHGERMEESNSVEILDNFSPSRRTGKESPLPSGVKCFSQNFTYFLEEESIRGGRRLSHTGANANMRPLTSYEKAKALGRARAFKSENPFFKAAMRPSYVHTSYRLCVPSSFARKYFTKNHGYVTLSVLDGRTWPVKYCNRTKSRVVFCHGWMAFAKDNKLAVGDFCIFELINITEMSFKVVFFRPEDVESLLSPAYTGGANQVEPSESLVAKPQSDWNSKDGAGISTPDDEHKPGKFEHSESRFEVKPGSETESKFISTRPFFEVVIRSSYLARSFVCVPVSFVERYFKHINQFVMLQVEDRSWSVKLIPRSSQRVAVLSAGWARFARENSLKVGDVCVFEMIKNGVLKVIISRSGR